MVPRFFAEFVETATSSSARLKALKQARPLAEYGWYPYDTLSALAPLEQLLRRDYQMIQQLLDKEPVLDLGCADGDLAFVFEAAGAEAVGVDHPESNYNQMRGVRRLAELLSSRVRIHAANLDEQFDLPDKRYSLALFLGTLYHIKNPYYVMERLARCSAWCVVSTRIAQQTSRLRVAIKDEPLAYLLDAREANDDPTNFWIFSETGLLRLADRTGWTVRQQVNSGCQSGSNPVDRDADERIFLLLQSKIRYPELQVGILDGWHYSEGAPWCWSARRFSFEVRFPAGKMWREFALHFVLPDAVIAASPQVRVRCSVNGTPLAVSQFESPGPQTYRGSIREFLPTAAPLLFEFVVEHAFEPPAGERRELGVILPFSEATDPMGLGIPFRVS